MTEPYVRQGLQRALNGLKMLLGRGRVILNQGNDQGPVQVLQTRVSAKEVMDLPRLAEFGFASRPPENSDCAVVFLNAERTWGIIVATGNQKARMKLANDGEAAIHDAFGADGAPGKWIWAKKKADDGTGGGWEIEANGEPVTVNNAKKVTINAGADGVEVNSTGPMVFNASADVTWNMNGHNFNIEGPGKVNLAGASGGKKIALDQDPIISSKVQASSTKVTGQ